MIITEEGHAWFNIDGERKLSEWVAMFKRWQKIYGDVPARTDAGYNNVEMVLIIPKKRKYKK